MYIRVVSLVMLSVLACTGVASAITCSHPASTEILRALSPENTIAKASDILKGRKANFRIEYRAGARAPQRQTTSEELAALKYDSLYVYVYSTFPGGFIVTYDELLSLVFNSQGVLISSSCRKFGTGP